VKENRRYWVMIGALVIASLGLHGLSHGEPIVAIRPLSTFPKTVNGLVASDVPLPKDILQVLGVDDYLNRVYQAPQRIPVSLYVGYYKSQRTGVTIHSPKNCLPGAGWEPVSSGYTQLKMPGGKLATVNLDVVEKGLDRLIVIYWYQSHGRVIGSEYKSKIYMVLDAIRTNRTDAALVRVTAPVSKGVDDPRRQAEMFAQQSLALLQGIIPR
jgi:EpsI family protein